MSLPRVDFTAAERRLVRRLSTPLSVQRWLDGMPYNAEKQGGTLRTFRGVVAHKEAHCLEAALSAATILEQHGYEPTVLDICSQDGLDHVLFLFRHRGKWGTVARSRDLGLHGRKPVFGRVRDLVYTYFDPFVDYTGRIVGYGVRDLRDLDARGVDWRLGRGNLWAVQDFLIDEPVKKIAGSDARYAMWKRRYLAFKQAHPNDKPGRGFYDDEHWL